MSELEIKRRQEYKRNRKKWMIVQLIAIILLAVTSMGSFLGYNQMNRTHYIEYSESGNIDYKVHYAENEFFEEEWIGRDQSYISALTDGITADFLYKLNTNSEDMGFDYTYSVDARLVIAHKDTGAPYYTYEKNLIPAKSAAAGTGEAIRIKESVDIDYVAFNEIAKSFTETYGLENASCTLMVTLNVNLLCANSRFEQETANSYSTSLNIPMAVDTFSIHSTASSAEDAVKVLEYKSVADRNFFYISAIVTLSLSGLCTVGLLVFMHLTKNEDVTYAAKIRRILRSYSSFIQRVDGEFDCEGYQIVMIKTFPEMLGIRDTIQSPILVFENRDETMTRFLIPTNTKILYTFEIKVDNFDEIYAPLQPVEEPVEEEIAAPVILEEVNEEDLAEAIAQPDVNLEEIEFVPDDDDQFEAAPEDPGVEVVGVVWPERSHRNKVYRYDPNGETLHEGDVVLVPTRDNAKGVDVIRKVAVAHGNHRVDPEHIKHPLKKIIAVIKRRVSTSLTPEANESAKGTDEGTDAK